MDAVIQIITLVLLVGALFSVAQRGCLRFMTKFSIPRWSAWLITVCGPIVLALHVMTMCQPVVVGPESLHFPCGKSGGGAVFDDLARTALGFVIILGTAVGTIISVCFETKSVDEESRA